MSQIILREIPDIGTVGELKAALSQFPDDTPVSDCLDEPLLIEVLQDEGSRETSLSIR